MSFMANTRAFSNTFFQARYFFDVNNIRNGMEKFSNLKMMNSGRLNSNTEAAVLIPICEINGEVSLLYTLRATSLRSHRGQVSFPGGKKDSSDKSIEETALRETVEELGINSDRIEIWGKGKGLITKYKTKVIPVIGRIKDDLNLNYLKTNPYEVEEVFTVSLQNLCNSEQLGYTQFRALVGAAPFSGPVFLGGKHRIWGITGFLTHLFLKCFMPPDVYKHPVKFVPPILLADAVC